VRKAGGLPLDENMNDVQVFPLKKGCFGETSGPEDIDTSAMTAIKFDEEVTIYVDGDTSHTYTLERAEPAGVEYCDTIHVDAAANYVWM
jgi:hypothetical protein